MYFDLVLYGNIMLNIYHGSENIIEKPYYGGGKPYNDYGRGFYCSETPDAAREWSVGAGRDGIMNKYLLDTDGLAVLHLNNGNYTILHWLGILLQNRRFPLNSPLAREAVRYITEKFPVPYERSDIIIGYRADDSYFSFASDFVNGTISVRQLEEAMHLGRLGEQVVLKSRESFERIRFDGYELVKASEWYPKKEKRSLEARKKYFTSDRNEWHKGELYITTIPDQEIGEDDARIQRIVY